jgi:chromosome segregation ATPase
MSDERTNELDTRPMLEAILERLNSFRAELNSRIDALDAKVDALDAKVETIASNFDRFRLDVRGDIRSTERQLSVLNDQLLKMRTDQTVIEDRLDRLESKIN